MAKEVLILDNIRVSIVLPIYNAERYVKAAIDSVLGIDRYDFELILVDDCSTDASFDIISEYSDDPRVVIVKNDANEKVSKSRNRGIGLSKGRYVATMDSDDISDPQRVHLISDFLELNPEIGVCGCSVRILNNDGDVVGYRHYPVNDDEIRRLIFRYNPFCHPAVVFRKKALIDAGLYNGDLNDAEDYDLLLRVGRVYKFHNLSDILFSYRLNENSVSHKNSRSQEYKTLYVRLKAFVEYGYKPSWLDVLYSFAQFCSMFIVPQFMKIKLFNFFRTKKICEN
jgi:glycosyltransferase involved in cell wall biosynthesis